MTETRVLHVITGMDPELGGVCQAVRTMVTSLSDVNVASEVVSIDDPDAPFINKDAFAIHALGPPKGPWWYTDKLMPWLNDNLSRFDVVIVHGLWLYHGYAVIKTFKRLKVAKVKVPKLYIMPHGMLDPYFQKAAGRKLKAIRNWLYWKAVEAELINSADGLLFTCETERLLAREPFSPYHPKSEAIVGLGVTAPPMFNDGMRYAFNNKCPEFKDETYLLFISRIHEKKGVDLLVKAYEAVSNQNKTGVVMPKLVIAGPGIETAFGQKIKELVSASSTLQASVFFPGMLTGDAKWGAFYGCEAFVLPSHQENFGIAVAEAMACNKPVLITNRVNIWNEIEQGNGGIVANDDLDGIIQLLNQWLSKSQAEKEQLGAAAGTTFIHNFGIRGAVSKLKSAIQ